MTQDKQHNIIRTPSSGGERNRKNLQAGNPEIPERSCEIPERSYELRIFQSLRRIIRAIELHSRKLVTEHQVTGPQLVCLLALQSDEPLTVKKLAQKAFLSPSTVVGIIDRLEEKGLVTRTRSSNDRRAVLVTVTDGGHRLLSNAPSPIQESLSRSLKGLHEKEMLSITLAFERIVNLMEACDIDAAPILETGCLAAPTTG